jgi:hypothetical protein
MLGGFSNEDYIYVPQIRRATVGRLLKEGFRIDGRATFEHVGAEGRTSATFLALKRPADHEDGMMFLRPHLRAFVKAVEQKLRLRDEKYGDSWKRMELHELIVKFEKESAELFEKPTNPDEWVDNGAVASMGWVRATEIMEACKDG